MTFLRTSTLLAVLLAVVSPVWARASRPLLVEIDGCIMPAPPCDTVRDTIRMREGDRKLDFGVERLTLPTSTASSSNVLTELKLRGVSVHGPDELTGRLVGGAHVRVRGVLRPGPYLLLQSVEPRPEPSRP